MAQVDGQVNHFEQMHIAMLSNTLGVDHSMVASLKDDLDQFQIKPPETYEQKVEFLWRTLTTMKMGMLAYEEEILLCKDLGTALKLPKHEVEALTNYMVQNVRKFIKLEQFESQIEEFKSNPNLKAQKSLMMRLLDWMNLNM
jgi:hypothetical protein